MRLLDEEESSYDTGAIYYKEYPILELSDKELVQFRGNEVSYVFQNPHESLNPNQRIGKQILEVLKNT